MMTGSVNDLSKHFNNITPWPMLCACVFGSVILSTEYARSLSVSLCLISDPENVVHTRGNCRKRLRSRTNVHSIAARIRAFMDVDIYVCMCT